MLRLTNNFVFAYLIQTSLAYTQPECHTISVILGTLFISFLAFTLLLSMLYCAYFKSVYDSYEEMEQNKG